MSWAATLLEIIEEPLKLVVRPQAAEKSISQNLLVWQHWPQQRGGDVYQNIGVICRVIERILHRILEGKALRDYFIRYDGKI